MPRVKLTLRSPPARSPRAREIRRQFDIGRRSEVTALDVSLPLTTDHSPLTGQRWQIGAIVGPSGSGKSQILQRAYGIASPAAWPADVPLVDALSFPLARSASEGAERAAAVLSAVGLGSIPAWLRPFRCLSVGEQFRANIARAIAETQNTKHQTPAPLVIDEFTSTLDRATAKSACYALQRFLRNPPQSLTSSPQPLPRLIIAGCHDDMLPWLSPDWTLRLPAGQLDWRRLCPRKPGRPRLAASLHAQARELWPRFAPHHYLTGDIHPASRCYVLQLAGELAAFCATLHNLGRPNWRRITRLVTLPQYQGLGLGLRLAEAVAAHESGAGFRPAPKISIVTSHPALVSRMSRSPRWQLLWARNRRHDHQLADHAVAGGGNRRRVSFLFVS